jgi:hypothetical protein
MVHGQPSGHAVRTAVTALIAALALVVAAAAISEAAVALRIAGLGAPDGGWSARDIVLVTAAAALFFGGPILVALASTPVAGAAARSLPLAAVATAGVVVARYLSYDQYYAPTLRRMSDGGILPAWWIVLVAVLPLIAAVLSRREPRIGLAVAGAAMFLAGPTIFVAGAGH